MGNFMMPYIENEVFKKNPFATLDTVGSKISRPRATADRGVRSAFGAEEKDAASGLVKSSGITQLCRMLLNTNEFVYVD